MIPGAAALAVVLVAAASCGAGGDDRTVRVFAAASLTDAFAQLEVEFEAAEPGVDVVLNLAGSSSLREQILDGAPADVFASASEPVMTEVAEAGAVAGSVRDFAVNRVQLAVPAGNPAGVDGVGDLADPDLLIGLCAPSVPCGAAARSALSDVGVDPSVDTEEPDVRALLTKLAAGELDAGVVYTSDIVTSDGRVEGVGRPDDLPGRQAYPIARLVDAPNPEAADDFVDLVLSERGREILAEAGFLLP